MHVLKQVQITAIICGTALVIATAGEPDILDSIQIRIMTSHIGFCRQMGSPLGADAVAGKQGGTNP